MKNILTLLTLLFFCSTTYAQVCDGIPGELVYTEDFGAGDANPGPALPDGTTDYNYGAIGAGNYTVVNDSGQNGSLWHSAPDHTPNDNNGYMLLFDGSDNADLFFRTEIDELCANTNYSFSAWVANIGKPTVCGNGGARPNLAFVIRDASNGDILGQVLTGPIEVFSSMTWQNVGISFRTPSNINNILIEIRNTVDGSCGNDFVLDDFSFSTCIPVTEQEFSFCAGDAVQVGNQTYTMPGFYEDVLTVPGSCQDSIVRTTIEVEGTFMNTVYRICEGESVQIGGVVYTDPVILIDTIIDPSTTCPMIFRNEVMVGQPSEQWIDTLVCIGEALEIGGEFFSETGEYDILLASSFGCDSLIHLRLETFDFSLSLAPDQIQLELGEVFQPNLIFSQPGNYQIQWIPADWVNCSSCLDPIVTPLSSGQLEVQVTELSSGCVRGASISIQVSECQSIYVPNAFSPNDDGVNDCFEVYTGACVSRVLGLQIFDRWGGQVFQSNESGPLCWDGDYQGQPTSTGVYVYQLMVELIDNSRVELAGDLLLLR